MKRISSFMTICMIVTVVGSGCIGCTGPLFEKPIGKPAPADDLKALKGPWKWESNSCIVELTKEGFVIGILKFDEDRHEFEAVNVKGVVTEIGKQRFLFLSPPPYGPPPEKGEKSYGFLLIEEMTESRFTLRLPDTDLFEDAIKSGKLEGSLLKNADSRDERRWPLITANEEMLAKFFELKEIENLFPQKGKTVWVRLNSDQQESAAK